MYIPMKIIVRLVTVIILVRGRNNNSSSMVTRSQVRKEASGA